MENLSPEQEEALTNISRGFLKVFLSSGLTCGCLFTLSQVTVSAHKELFGLLSLDNVFLLRFTMGEIGLGRFLWHRIERIKVDSYN